LGGSTTTRWPNLALITGVFGEGAQGFWSGARGGGEKVSITLVTIGTMGSPEFFNVGCSTPFSP